MEENQTFEEEVKIDGETQINETETEKTGGEAIPQKEEIDYKTKFSESSKEAQRLYEENKRLQAERDDKDKKISELAEERQRFEEEIASANPDGLELAKMKENIHHLEKTVVLEKEERELTQFISLEPKAVRHKEALKKLMRADTRPLHEIWKDTFSSIYNEKEILEKKETQKRNQIETGKGNRSEISGGEISLDEFNKFSLNQQKEYLKKKGY